MLPTPDLTAPPAPETPAPPAANPWPALLRVALLGTRQCSDAWPALPALSLADPTPPEAREQQLQLSAGALALMQKAGFQPLVNLPIPTPAPPDTERPLGPQGTALLKQLLASAQFRVFLLGEYLGSLAQHQRRVPAVQLVEVLGWLKERPYLAASVAGALGSRGRWLAAQNPDWRFVLEAEQERELTEADWQTGPLPRRRLFLEQLSLSDLPRAGQLLAATLPQEAAATQVALLGALEALPPTQPLPADFAPLLEALLSSRAKGVRQAAARWLARTAESPLLPRLWARAEPLLSLKRKLLGRDALTIRLPPAWSAEWQRDGIEQKSADYAGGEKAGQLGQLLALLPPGRWADAWGVSAEKVVALAAASEWAAVLLPAWLRAARLHHDADFALALLLHEARHPSLPPRARPVMEASKVLSPAQKLTWLLAALPAHAAALPPNSGWLAWLTVVDQPWPAALLHRVLPLLRAVLRQPPSYAAEQTERDKEARSLLLALGTSADASLLAYFTAELGELSEIQPRFADEVSQFLQMLEIRPQLAASLVEPV